MLDFVHFIDLHLDISIYFLKSGDDNNRDEDLQKDKDKETHKDKYNVFTRPNICYIFSKAGGSRTKNIILAVIL